MIDYSYPWETFSDSPTKIKINVEGDHKTCGKNQDVDELPDKVAKAIGRIPGYVRGGLTRFSMTPGCK